MELVENNHLRQFDYTLQDRFGNRMPVEENKIGEMIDTLEEVNE